MLLVLLVAGTVITSADSGAAVDRPMATLHEMIRAVNAGEAAAYVSLYAEDAVITIHGGAVLRGRSAIEAYEKELLGEFPGTRFAFYDVWRKDTQAVVRYGVNGRTSAGKAMGHEGLLFYRFDPSGHITDERRYLDSVTPMAQLGLLGPYPSRALPALPREMSVHIAGSASEEGNAALVRRTLAALDSKDVAAFLAAFAEDGVLDDLTEPAPAAGKPRVKEWFERWTGAVEGARSDIATVVAVGDDVLMETVVHGRLRKPLGRLAPAPPEFAVHRAVIARVRDGRIAGLTVFMNTKELAQAVGQWPPPAAK
jgi:ketosteroid isomerase-like protein